MERAKKISLIILCLFMISSNVKAADLFNNDNVITDITEIDESELYSVLGCDFYGSYIPKYSRSYIENKMGTSPYWRLGKNNVEYGIYKTDAIHYLIISNYYGTFIDRWYVSKIPSKRLFDKYVKIGVSLDVVKLIDQDLTDIINGVTDDYKITHHRFADGTYRILHYEKNKNNEYIVKDIRCGIDILSVVSNLLDIDYNLIKNDNNPNEEAEFLEKLKKLNEAKNTPKDESIKKVISRPSKIVIKSVKHTKKSIQIAVKKSKYAKKYQVQYATNRKFKKAKIKTFNKTKFTIKVKGKKNYYVRVRGVNRTKKGKWSKVKKVKLQKR